MAAPGGSGHADPKYEQIVQLRSQLKELQRRYDNQATILENSEDEVRSLRQQLEDAGASEGKSNVQAVTEVRVELERELFRMTQAKNELATQNGLLVQELHDKMLKYQAKEEELEAKEEEFAKLQEVVDNLKSMTGRLDREAQAYETLHKQAAEKINKLEGELAEKERILASLDSDMQDVRRLKASYEAATHENQRLKTQLSMVANNANESLNAMQNELQGNREFLEELRREYEEFVQTSRLQRAAFEEKYMADYTKMSAEYEEYKLLQYDDKCQILREHQEILHALQAQFDEYRTTAEFLFNAEAAKLEEKLNMQMVKFDQEIKYIIRSKDLQYDEMLANKDAKIMNLIEGTDLRTMLIKHQTELEHLRRQHQRDLDRQKAHSMEQQKQAVAEIQKQLAMEELNKDKYLQQRKLLEKRIEQTFQLIESKNKTISEKDTAAAAMSVSHQKKLEELHAQLDGVTQEKEHLRHRLIMIKLSGRTSGESIEATCRRLEAEMKTLSTKYESLLNQKENTSREHTSLSKRYQESTKLVTLLQHEIATRTHEFENLTHTFESFLESRRRELGLARARAQQPTVKLPQVTSSGNERITIPEAIAVLNKAAGQQIETEIEKNRIKVVESGGDVQPTAVDIKDLPMASEVEQFSSPKSASQARVKAKMPAKFLKTQGDTVKTLPVDQVADLERAYTFLRRFKKLSRAFTSSSAGANILGSNVTNKGDTELGPYETVKLYHSIEEGFDRGKDTRVFKTETADSNVLAGKRMDGTAKVADVTVYDAVDNTKHANDISTAYRPQFFEPNGSSSPRKGGTKKGGTGKKKKGTSGHKGPSFSIGPASKT